jgi:hypothetical protein
MSTEVTAYNLILEPTEFREGYNNSNTYNFHGCEIYIDYSFVERSLDLNIKKIKIAEKGGLNVGIGSIHSKSTNYGRTFTAIVNQQIYYNSSINKFQANITIFVNNDKFEISHISINSANYVCSKKTQHDIDWYETYRETNFILDSSDKSSKGLKLSGVYHYKTPETVVVRSPENAVSTPTHPPETVVTKFPENIDIDIESIDIESIGFKFSKSKQSIGENLQIKEINLQNYSIEVTYFNDKERRAICSIKITKKNGEDLSQHVIIKLREFLTFNCINHLNDVVTITIDIVKIPFKISRVIVNGTVYDGSKTQFDNLDSSQVFLPALKGGWRSKRTNRSRRTKQSKRTRRSKRSRRPKRTRRSH